MKSIRIYISCHKDFFVPKHPFLYPIQVGTELRAIKFPNMLYDNDGENISSENPYYCELTAQYWAWKNQESDYVGFFHYRRYLSFLPGRRPCMVKSNPNLPCLSKLGFGEGNMYNTILKYDIILPKPVNMYQTVIEQYKNSKAHNDLELERVIRIMNELYPEMKTIGEKYLTSREIYFCNMYIMKKEIFQGYCEWIFSILDQYDKVVGNGRKARIDGYLAERLFGIYFTGLKNKKNIKYLELPRVDFEMNNKLITKNKAINLLLPAGSWRKAIIRKIIAK